MIYLSDLSAVDNLDSSLSLRVAVQDMHRADPSNKSRATVDRADGMTPTREHELDRTDHTD